MRQRDHFDKSYIFVARRAGRRAGHRTSYVALDVASVVALVRGQSRDCPVCRRVPYRARAVVACLIALTLIALTLVCFALYPADHQ